MEIQNKTTVLEGNQLCDPKNKILERRETLRSIKILERRETLRSIEHNFEPPDGGLQVRKIDLLLRYRIVIILLN